MGTNVSKEYTTSIFGANKFSIICQWASFQSTQQFIRCDSYVSLRCWSVPQVTIFDKKASLHYLLQLISFLRGMSLQSRANNLSAACQPHRTAGLAVTRRIVSCMNLVIWSLRWRCMTCFVWERPLTVKCRRSEMQTIRTTDWKQMPNYLYGIECFYRSWQFLNSLGKSPF